MAIFGRGGNTLNCSFQELCSIVYQYIQVIGCVVVLMPISNWDKVSLKQNEYHNQIYKNRKKETKLGIMLMI